WEQPSWVLASRAPPEPTVTYQRSQRRWAPSTTLDSGRQYPLPARVKALESDRDTAAIGANSRTTACATSQGHEAHVPARRSPPGALAGAAAPRPHADGKGIGTACRAVADDSWRIASEA